MRDQGPKVTYAAMESLCEGVLQSCLGTVETAVDINRLAESLGIEQDRAPKRPPSMEQRLIALRGPQDEATRLRAAQRRRQADRLATARACRQRILMNWLQSEGAKYQIERCAYVLLMPRALVQKHCHTQWGDDPIPVYGEFFFLPEHRETLQKIADLLDVPFLDLVKRLDQLGLLVHKPEDDPVYEATWRGAYQKNLEVFLTGKNVPKPENPPEEKVEEPLKRRRSSKKGKSPEETADTATNPNPKPKPKRTRKPKKPPAGSRRRRSSQERARMLLSRSRQMPCSVTKSFTQQ